MTSRRPSKRELERALDDLDGGAGDAVTWGEIREWLWLDVRADGDGPPAEEFFGRPLTDDERDLAAEVYAELVGAATALDRDREDDGGATDDDEGEGEGDGPLAVVGD